MAARHVSARGELDSWDIGVSLATTRTHFEQRAVVAGDREKLLTSLAALAADEPSGGVIAGETGGAGLRAMLFGGQGGQRAGMGRELCDRFGVFAEALDAVTAELDPLLERPLREVLFATEGTAEAARLDQTGWTQPALFAVEVALFRLLSSFGLEPDFVLGHSVGEIAAAHVAGVLTLPDAARLVCARARLMQALRPGVMFSVRATEEEVAPLLDGRGEQISLAAVNGPASVVIGGEQDAVLDVTAQLEAQGHHVKRLRVSHAFHSPLMEPMLAEFRAVARELTYSPPAIAWVSTLTGRRIDAGELGSPDYWPDYWTAQVRQTVRFADGVRRLRELGVATFVDIGPDAALSALVDESLGTESGVADSGVDCVPLLRPDRGEEWSVTTALARLHVRGTPVDWVAFFAEMGARPVELPTYAFQRQMYWPDRASAPAAQSGPPDSAPPDRALWGAVERQDAGELATLLGLADEQHAALYTLLPALSSWRQQRHDATLLDSARYRVQWRPVPPPAPPVLEGTWLVVTAEGIADGDIMAALRGHGALLERPDRPSAVALPGRRPASGPRPGEPGRGGPGGPAGRRPHGPPPRPAPDRRAPAGQRVPRQGNRPGHRRHGRSGRRGGPLAGPQRSRPSPADQPPRSRRARRRRPARGTDRPGDPGPGRGHSPVHPAAPAGHLVQVMLSHRRGLQRDVHDLVRGGHAQVSRGAKVRAARARPGREVRHPLVRAPGPGQVRSRGAWLPAGLAPALTALRLRRRRRAAGQVIGGRGHRGIAAVTAQPAPQIPYLRRQRHHISPQLPDRGSLLLQHARLICDHRVPGGTRLAARRRRRQNGHNQPSSSPPRSNQHDTPGRLRKDQVAVSLARHPTRLPSSRR